MEPNFAVLALWPSWTVLRKDICCLVFMGMVVNQVCWKSSKRLRLMEVVREGKYALMNWDRTTEIFLPHISTLTQLKWLQNQCCRHWKITFDSQMLLSCEVKLKLSLRSFHCSQHLEKEVCLPGVFLCGWCLVLFLPSKSLLIPLVPGDSPGGGKWGNGIMLRPSVNAQAHPQDSCFQFIKHRMQLFTEGFTANPLSLNKWEKKNAC